MASSTCTHCGVKFSDSAEPCSANASPRPREMCANYQSFKHLPEDAFTVDPNQHLEQLRDADRTEEMERVVMSGLPAPMLAEAERIAAAVTKRGDPVRRPNHYARWKNEPIKFLIENEVNGTQFNVVKYVMRYQFKNGVEDLKKARRYLDMEIKRLEGDPDWSL